MNSLLTLLFCAATVAASHLAPSSRIINGENATLGQFPWHVGVAALFANLSYVLCSGAILNENWVITTAHCVSDGPTAVGVHAGSINNEDSDGVTILARLVTAHEEFDSVLLKNDIAVISLQSPLTFDENTQPISLSDEVLEAEVKATVAGWGHSEHDNAQNRSTILQYTTVSTIDNADCVKVYGSDSVTENVVCTSEGPCVGDGGAPLVVNADGDPVLVALFSFIGKPGCEEGLPGGYTRISAYKEWIELTITEKSL